MQSVSCMRRPGVCLQPSLPPASQGRPMLNSTAGYKVLLIARISKRCALNPTLYRHAHGCIPTSEPAGAQRPPAYKIL